jgi:hypothetical protein
MDFNQATNEFVISVSGIELNELMKLEQQEGLTGSGVLDGSIPVTLANNEILVNDGKMAAREPGGVIRYSPTAKIAAMAQSNTSIGMMVKALSHFQYHKLEVNSDYKSGGDMLLRVKLEGKSRDWQSGQPVNLNLNLHENIPTLLRSLQLSDEISEQVQKQYK